MRRIALCLVAAAFLVLGVAEAKAQDLEPRGYVNTPIGLNFLVLSYMYSTGDVATDASLPLQDGEVEVHAGLLAYARSFELFGRSAKVDLVLPYASADGSAVLNGVKNERQVDGLGDPRLRLSYNWVGGRAITLEEYPTYQQEFLIGTSVQIIAPLGQYQNDKLLNIGTNRWAIKPEIGMSKPLGNWTLELVNALTIYTTNDNFFGNKKREQSPLYSLQSHAVYSFPRGIWAALDFTWYLGGRTTVDGAESDDLLNSSRIGATLAMPLSRNFSFKVYGSTGITSQRGTNFDTVGTVLQYRWGGGL